MSPSPRFFYVAKLVVFFSLVITATYFLLRPAGHVYHDVYHVAVSGKKGAFVRDVLETEIDGPFDQSHLAALCRSKTWTPGLIFKCEAPQGGIGNVRNVFLNCVRYAIEAGASDFIIPEIIVRGPTHTELHARIPVPFTHIFDLEHFTTTMSTSCPQMHLYASQNDLWDKPSTAPPVRLRHPQLLSPAADEPMITDPANWAVAFNAYLDSTHPATVSVDRPILISLNTPLLEWPLSYDDPAFVGQFGRILRFRPDIRRLAATVLFAITKKHGISLDPDAPGIQSATFYGAHLRTASDAVAAGWTPYSTQAANCVNHASQSHLRLIYLASDSLAYTEDFKRDAWRSNITVATRGQLLAGKGFEKELAELEALTWDQKNLVDWEVLLRAASFGGTWESSFSWAVAARRHVALGQGKWLPATPLGQGNREESHDESHDESIGGSIAGASKREESLEGHQGGDVGTQQSFSDAYSTVFGPPEEGKQFGLALWP